MNKFCSVYLEDNECYIKKYELRAWSTNEFMGCQYDLITNGCTCSFPSLDATKEEAKKYGLIIKGIVK